MSEKGNTYMSTVDSTAAMAAKVSPAAIGTGFSFSAVPWSEVAAVLTCVYTSFLISDWLWKKFKVYRAKRNEQLKD